MAIQLLERHARPAHDGAARTRPGRPDLQDRQRRLPCRRQRAAVECVPGEGVAGQGCSRLPAAADRAVAARRSQRRKQIAPIAYGGGANGKTTYIETVCFALGDYAMTAEPTLLMSHRGEAHPTGVADLLGKRFVSTTETQQGARFDIALMKRLTGGDTLKARLMRQDFFSVPAIASAADVHQPPARDRRRQRGGVAPHPADPVHRRDPRERTRREPRGQAAGRGRRGAELGRSTAGWTIARRGLAEPEAVWLATADYKAESDAVGRFIEDECETGDPQASATTGGLHARGRSWSAKEGCLPLSRIAFGRALDAKGYPADQKAHGRPRRRICLRHVNSEESAGQ